jgi:hypothetical protein
MNKLRTLTYSLLLTSGFICGMMTQSKITKRPILVHQCPIVKCPDLIHKCNPAVEVQSLDLTSIRKIKGNFTYSPIYNGDVIMRSDTIKK